MKKILQAKKEKQSIKHTNTHANNISNALPLIKKATNAKKHRKSNVFSPRLLDVAIQLLCQLNEKRKRKTIKRKTKTNIWNATRMKKQQRWTYLFTHFVFWFVWFLFSRVLWKHIFITLAFFLTKSKLYWFVRLVVEYKLLNDYRENCVIKSYLIWQTIDKIYLYAKKTNFWRWLTQFSNTRQCFLNCKK